MALVLDGTNKITATELADDAVTTAKIADSAITDALLPADSVLQIVNEEFTTTNVTTTSTSFVDTGLEATITPSATTSKILVLVNAVGLYVASANTAIALQLNPSVGANKGIGSLAAYTASTASNAVGGESASFLLSPNTTSSVTYKLRFASTTGDSILFNARYGSAYPDVTSTITLMEIAG